MKRAVQLHPVTVMLSLLAGGALAGFWGVLLGVPGVAVTKLLASHMWRTRVLQVPPVPEVEPTVGERPPVEEPEEKTTPRDVE
jgi:predicted PurR-regulated permease PerM